VIEEILRRFADWSNKNSGLSQILIWVFGLAAAALGAYGHLKAKSGYRSASSKGMAERLEKLFVKVDGLEERMSAIERAVTLSERAIVRLTANQERIAVVENKLSNIEDMIRNSRRLGKDEKAEELDVVLNALNELRDRLDAQAQ